MSTKRVTDKILANAKGEADKILTKYKEEAKAVAGEYNKRIADRKEQIEREAEEIKRVEIMRTLSLKKLELRKKITEYKQQRINDISKKALEQLVKHSGYVDFLKALIKNSGEVEGSLLLSRSDAKEHRKELEEFMHKEGMNLKISVSDDMNGGIVIKKEKTSYIGSLDMIAELLSNEMAIAVSKTLYGNIT
jgi:V/A-type H+-transporting ATPase subunit E